VPRLGGDPVEWDAGERCSGGVAGAHRVSRDAGAVQSGGFRARPQHAGGDVAARRFEADRVAPGPGEQGAGDLASNRPPGIEGGNRVCGGVLSVGDGDRLAVGFLVHLGAADVKQEPGGLGLDVGQGERDELGATHRRGIADEDDRGVADPDRSGSVDVVEDLANIVDRERPGEASGRSPLGASQVAANLLHGFGRDRVVGPSGAVDVADHGACHVQGAGRLASFGAFGQAGADGERVGGQGDQPAFGAPALPLTPDEVVEVTGAVGARCGDRLDDAGGVGGGKPGRQQVEVSRRARVAVTGKAAVMIVFTALS